MKCISKDIDCKIRLKQVITIVSNTNPKNLYSSRQLRSVFVVHNMNDLVMVIWVVVMLSVLSYEMKKLRIRRYRPPVRLENPNRSVHGRYSVADNLPDSQGQAEPVMEVVEKVGEFESADA
ncbi:hypothetical protein RF11_09245 [Thelohanellus kitauei]|uniref:Uncharacterized protein n=1 Tax=Thelohanellus kitauei TaxID=669202 RepID=A0A0C2N4F4_THEKT|nr:hypothetical protein RF11_09245 [Thelohanellus kitauei]